MMCLVLQPELDVTFLMMKYISFEFALLVKHKDPFSPLE